MVRGADILPVLLFAALYWICSTAYKRGYEKGVEDERKRHEEK